MFRRPADAPTDPIVAIARGNDAASPKAPTLEIRKAIYGDFSRPDGGRVDVTAKLAKLVKDGCLEVSADNKLRFFGQWR